MGHYKLSQEHKRKISISLLGRKSPMKNRYHSQKTKLKMSLNRMGDLADGNY